MAKRKAAENSRSGKDTEATDFPIVGIGASAGGLEALEAFFSSAPEQANAAFVVIQHLSPDHKSLMSSILDKHTKMKVLDIEDGASVEPGCIYVNSPDKEVSISNFKFCLFDPTEKHGFRLPINFFFRSLAESLGDKSICVILSGTGTDGTQGLKAVKAAGGMAIVQDENQARYNNMPRSAIDTGQVDFILPVEDMVEEILNYIKHPYIKKPKKPLSPKDTFEKNLQKIFVLIRSKTGQDFSHYKQNTTRRRIERRMAVHQISRISEYVHYLQENPVEIRMLFKDMLITVTNFFRDPKAFDALNDKVIKNLLKSRKDGEGIRVWVPGCATGEEAYSIAILFAEAAKGSNRYFDIQVFATDIDSDAITHARAGVYPSSIAADVSQERLKQFFIKEENTYCVKKSIREMVVFAVQNLIKDAPFSKLDLVCCRNVLIYMDSTLQKKILPLFHFTLKPGGYLFLGTSETIGDSADIFSPVDTKWKIFTRKYMVTGKAVKHPVEFLCDRTKDTGTHYKATSTAAINIRKIAEKTILQNYAPPAVLINDKYEIVYFHGNTEKYLILPKGEPTFDVLKMVRQELRISLSNLLSKAQREKDVITSGGFKIKHGGHVETVNITICPVLEPAVENGFMMIMFETVSGELEKEAKKKKNSADENDTPRIKALEQELASTKEYLQTTIEELETSNEELKSTNEELQSTNEELQSTNEELETSREELRSTNEELLTVNSELNDKIRQLCNANDDLNNIMSSTDIATLFLDNELRVKRFTPKMTNIFKLIGTDVGRLISDISHNLVYDELEKDVDEVLSKLGRIGKEIQSKDGSWYSLRILPYRTTDNIIDGVVITFVDISIQKINEFISNDARDFSEGIIQTVRHPLLVLDENLQVIKANKTFCSKFKVSASETKGCAVYELVNGQWDIPKLRELLEKILPENIEFNDFEVEHDFPGIGKKKMLLNGRRIFQGAEGTEMILLAIEDISLDK